MTLVGWWVVDFGDFGDFEKEKILECWEHEFSMLRNPLFVHFSSYAFTYSLKKIHVHHHGGIGLKMTNNTT